MSHGEEILRLQNHRLHRADYHVGSLFEEAPSLTSIDQLRCETGLWESSLADSHLPHHLHHHHNHLHQQPSTSSCQSSAGSEHDASSGDESKYVLMDEFT